ncbi:ABC transporter permease [Idiomarina tyrosinivorans]|uniref:ABC transporter permease n=1 Tax=Idiomarina tyrosinivorans TaxID=1445662 RepID=A0A432ZLP9_9GAMM|nr:FtsX-like permease family protein [Idiomarina tyrosinivorans]RUO78834.1 ABC transporter permease [Idiomarina tyrosinivorans]
MWARISLRLLRQELKRGELTVMALAIVLSVTAVLSLSVFSDRLQQGLMNRSSEFLAADRVLSSRREIPQQWLDKAQSMQLSVAWKVMFNSMAYAKQQLQLVDIKAVSKGYPLRGQLKIAQQPFAEGQATTKLPETGHAWVDSRLLQSLQLTIGDRIELGRSSFIISQVLSYEPDVGFSVFTDSPNVLIRRSDLAATGLIQPGSRVRYNLLLSGSEQNLADYYQWLKPKLNGDTYRWRSVEDGDSPLARSLRRAEQFMLLASLLGVILAATAVAVAAQRYCQRNYDVVAILKTLGAGTSTIRKIFIFHLLMLTLLSIAIGWLLGWAIQAAVIHYVAQQLGETLPNAGWQPYALAATTGFVSAVMFTLYPLLRLLTIPPLRVLRRNLSSSLTARWLQWLFCGGTIYFLLVIYSQQWWLSTALFAGGGVAVAILLLISRGFIRLSRQAGMQAGSAWRLAMAGLQRRASSNSVQMLSFATAIMLLLLVIALRNELLNDWQRQLPADAPNYFAVNVAADDVQNMQQRFAEQDVETTDFYPVVPGRLTHINDIVLVDEASKEGPEKQPQQEVREGVGRELSLTWRETLPPNNEVVDGAWWQPNANPQVSVETRIAERLKIALGDQLTFDIGGEVFSVPVTSIRDADWNSLQPNFYMIFNPQTLADFSTSYITSFYLPAARKNELYSLLKPYPEVSLIDLDAIVAQLREVVAQVSLAIIYVLVLVIIAGALVLVAQVQASMEERQKELVILRTLGAPGTLLRRSVSYEFLIMGAISGLIASIAMDLSLALLQTQVFGMDAIWHWRFWLIGPLAGAIVVALLGRLSCQQLLRKNTAELIRHWV